MDTKYYRGSLARIADLGGGDFEVLALPREAWATGDYVVGEVTQAPRGAEKIEGTDGRPIEVVEGDQVIGAFGHRAATQSAVGSWEEIGPEGQMEALTSAGLFGKSTSVGWSEAPLMRLEYQGHAVRNERKLTMKDFVRSAEAGPYDRPTILVIGTSMSAGKTGAARVIVRQLGADSLRVVGTKLAGAGRYKDILAMKDAGADAIYDFVDGGLPSSVCPQPEYREALAAVLAMISSEGPDVVVVEAGASPLEPYNGATLLATIAEHVRCTVLCASDPYAVVGVVQGFGIVPDFVSGIATNTSAGIELIHKLTGLEALNLLDPRSRPRLAEILDDKLGQAG